MKYFFFQGQFFLTRSTFEFLLPMSVPKVGAVFFFLRQEACLFHIGEDPCELDNVAARHPDVLDRMLDLLRWYSLFFRKKKNIKFK